MILKNQILSAILLTCAICLSGCTTPMVRAQSQSSILAHLGANGTTDQIPPAASGTPEIYAGFLIKLNAGGQIDDTLLPSSALSPTRFNQLVYLDSVNGVDTNDAGTVITPYQTFEYAAGQATGNTAFVFMPGTYANTTTSISNMTDVALIGMDPNNTELEGTVRFTGAADVTLQIEGMKVTTVRQQEYQDLDVYMYGRAEVLNQINRQYPTSSNSVLTLYRDPAVTLANPITTTNSAEILTHSATYMDYVPADTNDWWLSLGSAPENVADAFDHLSTRLVAGTNAGQIAHWSGSNWTYTAAGTTNQSLHGGSIPTWNDVTLMNGTNAGQMAYWDGTNWTFITGGSSNEVLFGSSPGDTVPVFKLWGDVYAAADVPYAASATEFTRIGAGAAATDVAGTLAMILTNMVPRGTVAGQMAYWDSTNWVTVAAGTTNQHLKGGAAPLFVDFVAIPEGSTTGEYLEWNGTNWVAVTNILGEGGSVGDLLRWDGDSWAALTAGSSVEVLWGGTVPEFKSPTWWGLSTNPIISAGTVQGQFMYWDVATNMWLHIAPGASNEVLWGGALPRWDSSVTTINWGAIGGDLTNQTDLMNYLTNYVSAGALANSNNWNTAYSWGDHATNGYLTSLANSNNWDTAFGWGDHSTNGYLTWVASPAATNSTGTAGMAAYSDNYLYICVSNATWRRTILSAW